MVLAMRSNKEDFSLIIPYVRFASQSKPENLLVLDTSVIIDGRIADLIDAGFLEGMIVVPRFVLHELQNIADSNDPIIRARGRRGLEMLTRLQQNKRNEVKIHDADFPEETEVDAKLVRLARALGAKLYTNDYNLGKVAELQSVPHINLNELAGALKPVILPGEVFTLRVVREGKDKGQGIGYLNDGTMVVINQAQPLIGQQVGVKVLSLLQTGAGVIIFADLHAPAALPTRPSELRLEFSLGMNLRFPVSVNGQYCEAEISFATDAEVLRLARWRCPSVLPNEALASRKIINAVEFAKLASHRGAVINVMVRLFRAIQELVEAIQEEPAAELAMVLIARPTWRSKIPTLGFAYLRRTWCHHLFLEFLATHPRVIARKHERIGWVGVGILHKIVSLAKDLDVPCIWGEATERICVLVRGAIERGNGS